MMQELEAFMVLIPYIDCNYLYHQDAGGPKSGEEKPVSDGNIT